MFDLRASKPIIYTIAGLNILKGKMIMGVHEE